MHFERKRAFKLTLIRAKLCSVFDLLLRPVGERQSEIGCRSMMSAKAVGAAES